jgi:hypothetical protein
MCLFHKWLKWEYIKEVHQYSTDNPTERPYAHYAVYKKICQKCGIEKFKRVRM